MHTGYTATRARSYRSYRSHRSHRSGIHPPRHSYRRSCRNRWRARGPRLVFKTATLSRYVQGGQETVNASPIYRLPPRYLVVVADDVPPGLHHEPRRDAVSGKEIGRDLVRARLSPLSGERPHLRPSRGEKRRKIRTNRRTL